MSTITCKFCQAVMPKIQLKLHLATFHKGERFPRNVSKPSSTVVSKSSVQGMDFSELATSLLAAIRQPSSKVSSDHVHVRQEVSSPTGASKRSHDASDEDVHPAKKSRFNYSEICSEHSGLTSCFYYRCKILHDFLAYAKNPNYSTFCVNHVDASACFSESECCDSIWDWLRSNGFVTKTDVKKLIQDAVIALKDAWKIELKAEMDDEKGNHCSCFIFIFHVFVIFSIY